MSIDNLKQQMLELTKRVEALEKAVQSSQAHAESIKQDTPTSPTSKASKPVVSFTKPKRKVDRVFIHCSASDSPKHDDVSVMDSWHKARGWSGVGYHYFIKKDGTIQKGRDINRTPAAQRGHNSGTIAICCHGLEEDRFTKEQFHSLRALCSAINQAYDKKITFHGHNEVAAKACPVFDHREVLKLNQWHYMK